MDPALECHLPSFAAFFFAKNVEKKCPPGNCPISPPKGAFELSIFLFPLGGICDRCLEGNKHMFFFLVDVFELGRMKVCSHADDDTC